MTVNFKNNVKTDPFIWKNSSTGTTCGGQKEILVDKGQAQNIQMRNIFMKHLRIHIIVSDFAKKFRDLWPKV